MSQNSFHQLVNEIKDHLIFHNNLSQSQQPVKEQLMVTLKQMGTFGNGPLVGMLSFFFASLREQSSSTAPVLLRQFCLLNCEYLHLFLFFRLIHIFTVFHEKQ
jgi:hypothetical protein